VRTATAVPAFSQRPGEEIDGRRPEHDGDPLDEEPPVVVGGEQRPALVTPPDDAEQVAGFPAT
jgi:hypothetical protein